ncbi:helix-turn-helix transcriptional regulator [Methylobacterium oryzihabitans]|uniref:AraC family transcriptional regulator n=1 Tax=Methylobacterium oryzihabitans TaxID=2499852 RepID=A0A437P4B3_9HYPH|nr:AraC family transcriptional regulator [Methylobacterium oryzihabitans]RVU17114.1 AraC family transcriptional regulator [Methylobacterium oryzihabitans]
MLRDPPQAGGDPGVSVLRITQATTATFANLYFRLTFLFFVRTGSKRVLCPVSGELVGQAGDVMIFPPASLVTMENRPLLHESYSADGVCFSDDLIEAVFSGRDPPAGPVGIQRLAAEPYRPGLVLDLLRHTLADPGLPPPIRRHRLLEPLIWLRENGVRLSGRGEEQPFSRVRRLIETDLARSWQRPEVAAHFAMSEATFRRWLARSGHRFSAILSSTRLERGLTLLQTTDLPVSRVALDCGFKTPSHFSDAFRARFGIAPRRIRSAGK